MEETGSIHSEDFLQPRGVEEKQKTSYKQEGVKSNTSNGKLYFPTGSGYIVNAASGFVYPYKVGSKQEKQFWRVTRAVTKDGVTDGVKTFYESPEQYEMHNGIEVAYELKETWRRSTRADKPHINTMQTKMNSMKQTYTVVK